MRLRQHCLKRLLLTVPGETHCRSSFLQLRMTVCDYLLLFCWCCFTGKIPGPPQRAGIMTGLFSKGCAIIFCWSSVLPERFWHSYLIVTFEGCDWKAPATFRFVIFQSHIMNTSSAKAKKTQTAVWCEFHLWFGEHMQAHPYISFWPCLKLFSLYINYSQKYRGTHSNLGNYINILCDFC